MLLLPRLKSGSQSKPVVGSDLATIALFAYNRPQHLQRCLASLRGNPESSETVLRIFLDGSRGDADDDRVRRVRDIAHTLTGFRDVKIVERESNWGLSGNIIDGVNQVLADQKSVIVVEDDLCVSPGFLRYMNQALAAYSAYPEVFSVSAYNYPRRRIRIPGSYSYDAFFITRHMCWGWGTWRDRWIKADWRVTDYDSLKGSESWRRSFREVGVDLPGMLDEQMRGDVDSWAIRWTHAHFIHHAVCLVPVDSLVNNLGTDGSGVHMKPSRRYYHTSLNGKRVMRLPPLVYVDPYIARAYKTVERRGLVYRAGRRILRLMCRALRLLPIGLPRASRSYTNARTS